MASTLQVEHVGGDPTADVDDEAHTPGKYDMSTHKYASKHIGIIGAGIAGLHLGLRLQRLGIDCTIITDRTPEQVARGATDQHCRALADDPRARTRSRRLPLAG